MAFNRQVILDIGKGGKGLRVSDLNLSFDIERTANLQNNFARFTIYNMKEEHRKQFLQKGNNVLFKASHLDEYANSDNIPTIFIGTLDDATTRKDNETWVSEISCIDYGANTTELQVQNLSLNYKEKTDLKQVLNDLAAVLNIPIAGIENVNITLNNGFTYVGGTTNLISKLSNTLKVNNLGLYFDNSEIIIYQLGQALTRFSVVNITPKTGLIGSPEIIFDNKPQDKNQKPDKIVVTSILNPKIRPKCTINLQSATVKGAYIVSKVNFKGDNFGGDYECKMELEP